MRLRDACAWYVNKHFGIDKQQHPELEVKPEHIIMGTGLITILNVVSRAICNPGDGILIAAPYYSGFDYIFKNPLGFRPVPVNVPIDKIGTADEVKYLEAAIKTSGLNINAVVLCNPHNPLGLAYHRDAIEAYCKFAETYNLHLISDEIYGQSVFADDAVPFTSVLSLDLKALEVNPARVHAVYSMSKDFSASGFRIGLFISRANPTIIQSLSADGTFMRVSSTADLLWSALLVSDRPAKRPKEGFKDITEYLRKNKEELKAAYDQVTSWLNGRKLEYIKASAGLFFMLNLRPIIEDVDYAGPTVGFNQDTPMAERESLLNLYFQKEHRVLLSTGTPFHMPESGWFRFVFSVRDEVRLKGLEKLKEAFDALQRP